MRDRYGVRSFEAERRNSLRLTARRRALKHSPRGQTKTRQGGTLGRPAVCRVCPRSNRCRTARIAPLAADVSVPPMRLSRYDAP